MLELRKKKRQTPRRRRKPGFVDLVVIFMVAFGSAFVADQAGAQDSSPAPPPTASSAQTNKPENKSTEADTNKMCPVLTDQEIDPKYYTMYHGRRVYLCCGHCLRKFEANPQKYVANLPAIYATPAIASVAATGGSDAQKVDDHAQEHDENMPHILDWIGKFHPLIVHFPIALLLSAFLAELLFVRTGNEFFATSGRFCLWIGAIGAICAGATGWLFGGFHLVDKNWVMTAHRWVGTATALTAVILLALDVRYRKRKTLGSAKLYRAGLALATLLVAAAGFFGGSLVYGLDHLKW